MSNSIHPKRVALITGAARGIGAATARKLASEGYAVCVNYQKNREKAEQLVQLIQSQGGKAIAVQADMGYEKDILRLFETVERQLGLVSALVNNAALHRVAGPSRVEEMPWEAMDAIFRVNTFGTIAACREAVKHMKQLGGGAIVNVSSEAARFGGNNMTAYAASKAAINTFAIGFAREAAVYNIRVNTISPGVIDTDAHSASTPERMEGLKASLPMGRMGKAEEVAETIGWLLSEKASYVSGAMLTVSGAR